MSPESINEVLQQLRERMAGDLDDDAYAMMRKTAEDISAWQKAGAAGELPHLEQLVLWEIEVSEDLVSVSEQPPSKSEVVENESVPEVTNEDGPALYQSEIPELENTSEQVGTAPSEPDEAAREAYSLALALLNNGRYHAAMEAFAALKKESSGDFQEEVQAREDEAEQKLAEQVRPLIEKAEAHAKKQPNDIVGARNLWGKVREIDPENLEAIQAERLLNQASTEADTRRFTEVLRQQAAEAVNNQNYPRLIKALTEAEGLQQSNELDELQVELDELVGDLTRQRSKLREVLGRASTLAVSGNLKEAYRQAREYLDNNVAVVFDDDGTFGPAGETYDPVRLLQLTRSRFLESTRLLALERKAKSDEQKLNEPLVARKTLEEAEALLTDEILGREDRAELETTLETIREAMKEVATRIERFDVAHALVEQARQPETGAEDQLRLFREAHDRYADYPRIDTYITNAEDAVASQEAGRVRDQITVARQQRNNDEYAEAIVTLQAAREHALRNVPNAKPGSSLAIQLQEVERQEQEIVQAEKDYNDMVHTLQEVDDLFEQHEREISGALESARTRLDQLNEQQSNHPLARSRRGRLIDLQGVGESWEQGRDAYRLGDWDTAVDMLRRVANSDAKESEQASRMMNRARAARLAVSASLAEGARNWKDALSKYRSSVQLFNDFPASQFDEQTELLHKQSLSALERLKTLEENDVAVQQVIQQATGLLTEAEQRVRTRQSPLSRVEPIDEFARAVALMMSIRDKQTTLTEEVEKVIRNGREEWRKAYLDGMKSAHISGDENILRKAMGLGEALDDNNLLYEDADKQIYQQVQEKYLDLELERLTQRPPRVDELTETIRQLEEQGVDQEQLKKVRRDLELLQQDPIGASALIEDNRRRRLDITLYPSDQLKDEYRHAVEQRVRHELSQRRQVGPEKALAFLAEESQKPELYQNESLFAELLHLCWEVGDWQQAVNHADSIAYRTRIVKAKQKSDVWRTATAMAQALSASDLSRFNAEKQRMQEVLQSEPELLQLLAQQEKWLTAWRVDTLVEEATDADRSGKDGQSIVAAQLYAEAYRLDPQNQRINAGLQSLGQKLDASLQARIREARGVAIRGDLNGSLASAERLAVMLAGMKSVEDRLGLSSDRKRELDAALEQLNNKISPWKQVQQQMVLVAEERDRALMEPLPFQGEEEGGWHFDRSYEQLNDIQPVARGDRELTLYLQEERDKLDELSERAIDLNEQTRGFIRAVRDEDFAAVVELSTRLETLWRALQVYGFRGLEQLIRYDYPYLKRNVKSLADHRKVAELQRQNLEQWQNWTEACEEHYGELRRIGQKLARGLDSLRQQEPLRDIETLCRQVLKQSEEFSDAVASRPEIDPDSAKAAAEELKISEGVVADVLNERSGYRAIALALLTQAQTELEMLESGPLRKLEATVEQMRRDAKKIGTRSSVFGPKITGIPAQRFDVAMRYYEQCQEIDPMNSKAARLRNDIRQWEGLKVGL